MPAEAHSVDRPAWMEGKANEDLQFRTSEEVQHALGIIETQVWLSRHFDLSVLVETGREDVDPGVWKGALAARHNSLQQLKAEGMSLPPYSSYEVGELHGRLAT